MKKMLKYIFILIVVFSTGCSNSKSETNGKDLLTSNNNEVYIDEDIDDNIVKLTRVEVDLEPTLDYESIGPFSEGLARVSVARNNGYSLYGYINAKGEEIITPKYQSAGEFIGGFAVVSPDGSTWTFIDRDETQLIKPIIGDLSSFSEGLAVVRDDVRFHGYIDTQGNKVITLASSDNVTLKVKIVGRSFQEGLAVVYDKEINKYGYIDKTGNLEIPFQYDEANSFQEGVAVVKKNNTNYAIDINGERVVDLPDLPDLRLDKEHLGDLYIFSGDQHMFSEGLLSVNRENEAYYVDKKGKIVLNNLGEYLHPFHNGAAQISRYDKEIHDLASAYINRKGKLITDFKYASYRVTNFSEGLVFQRKHNGEKVYINNEGDEIFSCYFGNSFNEGYASFQYEQGGPFGILRLITD